MVDPGPRGRARLFEPTGAHATRINCSFNPARRGASIVPLEQSLGLLFHQRLCKFDVHHVSTDFEAGKYRQPFVHRAGERTGEDRAPRRGLPQARRCIPARRARS